LREINIIIWAFSPAPAELTGRYQFVSADEKLERQTTGVLKADRFKDTRVATSRSQTKAVLAQ